MLLRTEKIVHNAPLLAIEIALIAVVMAHYKGKDEIEQR
jgi:hypothetical protein